MKRASTQFLSLLLVLAIAGSFSSCAYFNTFHNTKKLFKQARRERENRKTDKPSANELKLYDRTIEKASKILEVYPNSKYVDDAIMILGECFYYKGEYIKAQTKFEELITYFARSSYYDRARLWLAKTNLKLREYLAARYILEELRDAPKVKDEIRDEALLLLGDVEFEQEHFEAAKELYRSAAKEAGKKEIRAQAYFQLGLSEMQTQDYEDAVASFSYARKYSPNKQFAFEAELNYGRALKLAGDFKRASRVCYGLLEQDDFKNRHGEVRLELVDCLYREGKALQETLKEAKVSYLGKVEKSIDEYKKITLEFKRTEVAARAYFEMARIYEEDFGDFSKAKEYYEKVKLEYSRSELVPEAMRKAKDLGELIRLRNLVAKSQNKQLASAGSPRAGFSDLELLLMEHGVHPELRFMRRKRKEVASQPTNGDAAAPHNGKLPAAEADLDAFIANKLQLAETYLFEFGKMDSALKEYGEIIELFPDRPGAAKALYNTAFIYENEFHDKSKTDSLLYVLIERFPDTPQAQEARKILGILPKLDENRLAEELYKIAESTLLNDRDLDRAIRQFRKVVNNYPNTEFAAKALYAIGWIHEKLWYDNQQALAIYKEVVEKYPDTPYAESVRRKISQVEALARAEAEKAAAADSLAQSPPGQTTPSDSLKTGGLETRPPAASGEARRRMFEAEMKNLPKTKPRKKPLPR